MLKGACIHPDIIGVLASCGHGDRVLIADGNYPIESNTNENAAIVFLNLTHGIPLVTDVLKVLDSTVSIEKMAVMVPESGEEPEIFSEFRNITGNKINLEKLGRYEFYDTCKEANVKLAIATGEKRTFANILLTIGVA